MGIGLSVLLLAVGAILAFAVKATTFYGVDVHVVGWILMAAGLIGLIWSLVVISASRRRNVIVSDRPDTVTRVVDRDVAVEDVGRREMP